MEYLNPLNSTVWRCATPRTGTGSRGFKNPLLQYYNRSGLGNSYGCIALFFQLWRIWHLLWWVRGRFLSEQIAVRYRSSKWWSAALPRFLPVLCLLAVLFPKRTEKSVPLHWNHVVWKTAVGLQKASFFLLNFIKEKIFDKIVGDFFGFCKNCSVGK